jgi:N-acetyl-anhydromuramyl-L-alanine amidase AmpD
MSASSEFPIAVWMGPPKSQTSGRKAGQPKVIVIHTTEGSEGPASAEAGAAYDKRRTDGTSTHFFTDSNSIVQTVYTYNEAHAARAHGNDIGIQIEVCGRAGQTGAQWNDEISAATLERTANICVAIRRKYGQARFPLKRLTPAQVRAGNNGFCGHVDITKAFPEDKGTHTDPGSNFPWSWLFNRIAQLEGVNVAKKQHHKADLDGNVINIAVYGDDDRDFEGYWTVQRAQRLIKFQADGKTPLLDDGVYGAKTRDAVKARMAIAGDKDNPGTTIALAEWKVLSGIFAG